MTDEDLLAATDYLMRLLGLNTRPQSIYIMGVLRELKAYAEAQHGG